MEQKTISIEVREKAGKGVARKLRAQGRVPGVVYGKGIEPVAISLDEKEMLEAIAGEGGCNVLFTLQGGESLNGVTAMVADVQRPSLRLGLTHVDLHKVSLTDKVRVHVPVAIVGTAAGVREGGLLDVVMHALDVECLPTAIPERIDVDVTDLALGHAIHVGEIALPAGVKVLDDPKASVVSILGRAKEEAPASAEG
ncbi:50S ribosomal protein L25 [Geobacter pickeringii]|uniref:Large ribosomal subunit protein bL25 n=1 Tax=Geobacter pickeringii TaxID=345632 RepID=A0A0B5BEY4_9BACT|nr:50S ribosomal protein L25 [Geobacter pickeringii]AJE02631.1 50S ribosomal protein L25 [Geobacter pickeringii]